jgi:hypothetical protein
MSTFVSVERVSAGVPFRNRKSQQVMKERDFEPWVERYLWRTGGHQFFSPMPQSLSVIVENTATDRPENGRWKNPDLCMACVSREGLKNGTALHVFSFELKIRSGLEVSAVFQTLNHHSRVNFAYLVIHLPLMVQEEALLPDVEKAASENGVGVIRVTDVSKDNGYHLLVPAKHRDPAQSDLEDFICKHFQPEQHRILQKWIKS